MIKATVYLDRETMLKAHEIKMTRKIKDKDDASLSAIHADGIKLVHKKECGK